MPDARPPSLDRSADGPQPRPEGILDARGVGVAIGGQTLLAPVSFTLRSGRTLAVVGPNGSGKTTLLRVLAGLTAPTSGTVRVGGQAPDERRPAFRAHLAALIGLPPLARNLTVREHLVLVAASWGAGPQEAGVQADGLLEEFDVARLAARFPHELSSGQTQLFSLALTLARPHPVLLLDEPEQRLDPDRLDLVAGALERRRVAGATTVMASHHRGLVERLADRVLTLPEGTTTPARRPRGPGSGSEHRELPEPAEPSGREPDGEHG